MISRRMKVSIIMGIILGIFCIIGASVRSGLQSDTVYLFSLWYNRLVLGIMIGLTQHKNNLLMSLARGAVLGLVVSFAFYSAIAFQDVISFLAGIVYGVIIEAVAFKYGE
jgi:hypothetical protein